MRVKKPFKTNRPNLSDAKSGEKTKRPPIFFRPGVFRIQLSVVESRPDIMFMIQQHVLINGVKFQGKSVLYSGFSDAFEKLNREDSIPEYHIELLPPDPESDQPEAPRLLFKRLKERKIILAKPGDITQNTDIRKKLGIQ